MRAQLPQDPALAAAGVQWLPAEASARRYARLRQPRRVDAPTAVVMLFGRGTPPREVERVARATEHLARAGLPVPQVHAVDPQAGWILQEDLGDTTLAAARAQGQQVAGAYSAAIGLLEPLAGLTSLDTSPRPPLDARRMRDELGVFSSLALKLGDGPGAGLSAELDELARLCAERPTVLCHRDYHARNLLLLDGRVRVIDHQDALAGPDTYDRVSLAYDPYVELTDAIRDRIAGDGEGVAVVAVQRLCKALGTFADKGGAWLQHVPSAARSARRLLARDGLALPLLDLALRTLELAAPRADSAP